MAGDDAGTKPEPAAQVDATHPKPEPAPHVDTTFRAGSITAVGIVLGFSLSFASGWAADPMPWPPTDLLAVVPLVLGVGSQAYALARLFEPSSLIMAKHEHARRWFLAGVLLVATGICIALLLDVAGLGRRAAPSS
jgi:hypothetical protein